MKLKSILLIMPYGSVGGMERLALNFYNHYKAQGYQVKGLKFIKLDNDIINFGEDELFFKPYDFVSMSKMERLLFYVKAPYLINKLIKKYNITYSIAFGDMANLFSSLSFSKEYKIGSVHALKSVELKHDSLFNKLTKLGYKTSYKFLNKLVCISKAIKEDLIENCDYKFSNLEVIYNPHDIAHITQLSKEHIDCNEELDIFSKPTILFLGRLSIQKAPWHLIKAFSIVNTKNKGVNLVIIGDGDINVINYINKLIKILDIENQVFLLGRKNNPYKYIKAAKVLALTSYYEGTPNVIVESIAVGTPIVSTYCTKGITELMSLYDHNGEVDNIVTESGIVTPNIFEGNLEIPSNFDITTKDNNIAEAILLILNDIGFNNRLGMHKHELLSKFDLETVANKYLK